MQILKWTASCGAIYIAAVIAWTTGYDAPSRQFNGMQQVAQPEAIKTTPSSGDDRLHKRREWLAFELQALQAERDLLLEERQYWSDVRDSREPVYLAAQADFDAAKEVTQDYIKNRRWRGNQVPDPRPLWRELKRAEDVLKVEQLKFEEAKNEYERAAAVLFETVWHIHETKRKLSSGDVPVPDRPESE